MLSVLALVLFVLTGVMVIFYYMLKHQVEQSIALGFIKNLDILSSTLAALKQNEWENFGNDLSVTAKLLSD